VHDPRAYSIRCQQHCDYSPDSIDGSSQSLTDHGDLADVNRPYQDLFLGESGQEQQFRELTSSD